MSEVSASLLHQRLSKTLKFGDMVEAFPDMIVDAIRMRIWEKRVCRETGEVFPSLVAYVRHHEPDGLQVDPARIEQLISHSADAVTEWRKATVRGKGGERWKDAGVDTDNISINKHGTSRAYTLVRLERESPALFEAVKAGEMSANAAAIQAGIRKKPSPFEAAKRLVPKLSDDEWGKLCDLRARAKKNVT